MLALLMITAVCRLYQYKLFQTQYFLSFRNLMRNIYILSLEEEVSFFFGCLH